MMIKVVKPQPVTWPDDLVQRWRRVPVAVIADISEGRCLIDPAIRPLKPPGQQPRLFGFAVTAQCEPPDFGAVVRALDEAHRQSVLVIAAQGHAVHAMIGGILGGHLRNAGAVGIVCDGAVRDVAELAGFSDFAIYHRHITPRGPASASGGVVNGSVTVGGRRVAAGDLVSGDDDGVAALTLQDATDLIAKAEAKLVLEDQWIDELASGVGAEKTFGLSPAR